VVIGGTAITGGVGGLPQTIVGALILSVLRVGMGVLGINPLYDQIGYGLLLIIAIAISTDRSKIVLMK
jgi:ribose transport system permease protein